MTRLSDKYIAGFLDADSHIYIEWHCSKSTGLYRAYVRVKVAQKEVYRIVLDKIQEVYGGTLVDNYVNGKNYPLLQLSGKDAIPMLAKIGKYFVRHRNYIQYLLTIHKKDYSKNEYLIEKKRLKTLKRAPCLPIPKHPTRGWVAGYIDGDGCLQGSIRWKQTGAGRIQLTVVEMACYGEGVTLLHKAFGGSLVLRDKREPHLLAWNLSVPPTKMIELYEFFGKHLLLKRDQFTFTKGCAEMGHFRDGETIKQILSDLKVNPQRLNDSSCDVSHLLAKVKNLTKAYGNQHVIVQPKEVSKIKA